MSNTLKSEKSPIPPQRQPPPQKLITVYKLKAVEVNTKPQLTRICLIFIIATAIIALCAIELFAVSFWVPLATIGIHIMSAVGLGISSIILVLLIFIIIYYWKHPPRKLTISNEKINVPLHRVEINSIALSLDKIRKNSKSLGNGSHGTAYLYNNFVYKFMHHNPTEKVNANLEYCHPARVAYVFNEQYGDNYAEAVKTTDNIILLKTPYKKGSSVTSKSYKKLKKQRLIVDAYIPHNIHLIDNQEWVVDGDCIVKDSRFLGNKSIDENTDNIHHSLGTYNIYKMGFPTMSTIMRDRQEKSKKTGKV